jgi:plasmid stabilization system protein ParE
MKIIWTPEAKETFNANIEFLLIEWGDRVTADFLDRVDEVVSRIKSNPRLYPLVKRNRFIDVLLLNKSAFITELYPISKST